MDISSKIGILGGGQLGRMVVEASIPLALNVSILDENMDYPAAGICTEFYEGDFTNYDDVLNFGLSMDIITVEIESVNIEALKVLEMHGKKVFPQPYVLETIVDKGKQKDFYIDHQIPTASFIKVSSKQELIDNIHCGEVKYPFVQKLRTGGYDGRGVNVINSESDVHLLFDAPSVIEHKVDVAKEVAIIIARSSVGEVKYFPVVEMIFSPTANLVEYLESPADISDEAEESIILIAEQLADKLQFVGLLAVELFIDSKGKVWVNEVAPRPHNSGHHTIEANITSQFDQLLRAILGMPLGDTRALLPAAMLNLLGEPGYSGVVKYEGIEAIMQLEGVYPHLYNKKTTKPNRKMGHITITHPNRLRMLEIIDFVKKTVKVISK